MDRMPCGLDDPRFRYEPDEEETDPRTQVEKRLSWIEDDWRDALINDTYDDWRDMRMMIYGATQAMNQCGMERAEDRNILRFLGEIAFKNSLHHLSRGAA